MYGYLIVVWIVITMWLQCRQEDRLDFRVGFQKRLTSEMRRVGELYLDLYAYNSAIPRQLLYPGGHLNPLPIYGNFVYFLRRLEVPTTTSRARFGIVT